MFRYINLFKEDKFSEHCRCSYLNPPLWNVIDNFCIYKIQCALSLLTFFHFPLVSIYFWLGSKIIIIADRQFLFTDQKKSTCVYFMSMCAINMNRILFRHLHKHQTTHTPIYAGSLPFAYVVVNEGVGMRIAPAIYVSLCGK